jgi:hypothetical protein
MEIGNEKSKQNSYGDQKTHNNQFNSDREEKED